MHQRSGGVGPTANVVYKRMIAQKHDNTYSKTLKLDQMQTELLNFALSNSVFKRSKIQHSPLCAIPRHNGTSLAAMKLGSLYSELNPHALVYTLYLQIHLLF